MKICFCVCEYNPFHNGHLYHLEKIRKEIKPDAIAVVMSGNFTQRGEVAVLDKYTRAAHAVKAGADVVFELPTAFATSPAEIFAKGAIKLASSVKGEKTLCFGTESAKKKKLLSTAAALLNESREFKKLYREELKSGVTPVKAKVNALAAMDIKDLDFELLKSPNNILGIEYAKAVLSSGSDIELYPIIRKGAGYLDDELHPENSSAAAIRNALSKGDLSGIESCVPEYVFDDLKIYENKPLPSADDIIYYSATAMDKSEMKKIVDCTEGLENRIKALIKNCTSLTELKDKLKTKRYTYTRLNRILLATMLKTKKSLINRFLKNDLYLKVLAMNADRKDVLSYFDKNSDYPLITRKSDERKLSGAAKTCFFEDVFANDIYNFLSGKHTNEYEMKTLSRDN
ncbi:MAG: nucleotidyltransferase family protein [Clostridia bacterium]|nr:nucleotidyltransferase family protein [Clostridia bacterium]